MEVKIDSPNGFARHGPHSQVRSTEEELVCLAHSSVEPLNHTYQLLWLLDMTGLLQRSNDYV